ncbi:MAG: hypothetical protein ACRYG7_06475 [Janthinobacterium lividum]
MFKTFTWGQYFGSVAVLLALYYAYLALAYYRSELVGLFKGKGLGAVAPVASLGQRSSLVGRAGPLIPAAALAAAPPAKQNAAQPEGNKTGHDEDESGDDDVTSNDIADDNINGFAERNDSDSLRGSENESELPRENLEPDFSVGVVQLGDYLEAATEGRMTKAELVGKMPELENTELLTAFYKANAQSAQALTTQYYVGVAEPALD